MSKLSVAQEQAIVAKWIKEGKGLIKHGPQPPFAKGAYAEKLATQEANFAHLEGPVRRLFIRERGEGWLAAGSAENVPEGGGLLSVLTGGLLHGGTTTLQANPTTRRLEGGGEPSAVEKGEKAINLPSWGEFALKLLVNGSLLLAGVVLVVYGVMIAVRPREKAFSLPSAIPIPV